MGRRKKPLKPGKRGHLSVAIASELIIALDEEAERQSKAETKARGYGVTVLRSHVVETALAEWLQMRKQK